MHELPMQGLRNIFPIKPTTIVSNYLNDLFTLKNKIALVTGASSGIGRHLVKVYAKAGAQVIAIARREALLIDLVAEIQDEGDKAEYYVADLSMHDDFKQLNNELTKLVGAPDILVNTAGVNQRQGADELSVKSFSTTLDINLGVPFFLAQALVPEMIKKNSGRIINIASLQSFRAFENGLAYGASKGGIVQLTRAMTQAWAKHGITTNAIAPGFFPTQLTQRVFADKNLNQHHAQATAIGRNGEMQDLDGIAIFLASSSSHYISGQVIAVDGGYLAK